MSYSRYDSNNSPTEDLAASVISLALVASVVFGAAWLTSESKSEVARKPPLVTTMLKRARRCLNGDETGAELPQDARLSLVLEQTDSIALDTLIAKDITVCPDSRLSHQDHGFWDKTLRGVYHAEDKVVTLYDNGKSVDSWDLNIEDRGASTLEKIAAELDSDTAPSNNMYAGLYSCGKNCSKIKWKLRDDFDQDTLRKNPQFQVPPLQGRAPAIELERR